MVGAEVVGEGEGGEEEEWGVNKYGGGVGLCMDGCVYYYVAAWHVRRSFMGIKDRFLYLMYTVHLSSIC